MHEDAGCSAVESFRSRREVTYSGLLCDFVFSDGHLTMQLLIDQKK